MTQSQDFSIYFDDPRLRMSPAGRFLVRVASGTTYLFFGVLTFLLLISDVRGMQFFGIFLLLFWADRLIHYQDADEHIEEIKKEEGLNIADYLAPSAFSTLEKAMSDSSLAHQRFSVVLLKKLLRHTQIQKMFARLDVDEATLKEKINSWLSEETPDEDPYEVAITSPLMTEAFRAARANGHRFVQVPDVLIALFTINDPYIERVTKTFSLTPQALTDALRLSETKPKHIHTAQRRFDSKRGIMNRSWTSRATPTLDRFSTDLTELASEGLLGNLIGHKSEFDELLKTLTRTMNPNVLLVGEAGIGKNTIIEHLAAEIVGDRVPPPLTDRRLIQLHLSNAVSNLSPEELQGRLQNIITECLGAGNIILYIPDLHNLLHTSGKEHLSAADAFIPLFEKDALPIIGSTYPQEFKQYIEPRSDLLAYFEKITVKEVTTDEAFTILTAEARSLEASSHLTITVSALKKAVIIAKQYVRHRPLPGSALELLKESVDDARHEGKKILEIEDVVRVAERKVNIPIHRPDKEEAETLLHFENIIHKRFIDQEEAVKSVADALREYRSGLTRKNGPIASFLFVGPTGVGKTALTKLIAELQFGSRDLMIRFDMSEYQDKKSFMQFIGSADGTIIGALTEAVREKPRSVVLLDEFEKAYPDILHLFLQVLDEGYLTDGLGRKVSFENCVIVATSNAHSRDIETALRGGKSIAQIADHFKDTLSDVFPPELLNRFSKIIVFKNLSPEDIKKVTKLELEDFAKQLEEQELKLSFNETVIEKIATIGYDPAFGARPLRQAIEENLRAPLAKAMLEEKFEKGDKLEATLEKDKIVFSKKA
ncbi:MAG: ATP-dependent Clp protease ATP-binding subunit [Patescibacteria group bacterium]